MPSRGHNLNVNGESIMYEPQRKLDIVWNNNETTTAWLVMEILMLDKANMLNGLPSLYLQAKQTDK